MAGVLIEFNNVGEPEVYFYPIETLVMWRAQGRKSVGVRDGGVRLYGKKKRTRFRYEVYPWLAVVWQGLAGGVVDGSG